MPWRIRFLTGPEPWWGDFVDGKAQPKVGDAWYYANWDDEANREHFLKYQASAPYLAAWADKRPPVVVRLPPGFGFSPDERYYGGSRGENPERAGWTVTGSIEDGTLTVQPSINAVGSYHGFISNGVLGEDVEGRTYPGIERTA